tara:strand:- start:2726 stop:4282 length:1557 start_codon:yes stop_codon:yes gene_type:complete
MKKIAIIFFMIILSGCATVRFKGQPLAANPKDSKINELNEIQLNQWSRLDLSNDKIPGMSINRAYSELIKEKEGKQVIVAVIDSGIDIEHEDLFENIWVNSNEIPNNNIDDDKNGYVDDINGWNFLGESQNENLEYIRLLKKTDPESILFEEYEQKRQNEINDNNRLINNIKSIENKLKISEEILKQNFGDKEINLNEVKSLSSVSSETSDAIRFLEYAKEFSIDQKLIKKALKQCEDALNYHHNLDFDGRIVVGDNPDDFSDQNYGNSNVSGPNGTDNSHGTHVAGIIASKKTGIANNVKIMALRAVPNGDEYDKDVALAIRYAVDNGAKIINASFGKSYSPHSNWVYDAIIYASKNDVLFIHAAGNDGKNINPGLYPNYPNDFKDGKEITDNTITVGASSWDYSENLITSFSNYGNINVDVFAPGHKIYSTVPNNGYELLDGTSMAAPNITGIASVLRSFYSKYSASKIKKIILESGINMHLSLKIPSSNDVENPTYFSKTGKLANLYNALLYSSN